MVIELTYLGRGVTLDNKIRYRYLTNGETQQYAKAIIPAAVGTIISAIKTEKGVKAPYKIIGKLDDEDRVSQLIELDWSIKKEHDIKREILKPNTKYKNLVNEINSLTSRMSRNQRSLFKYKLLNDLR